MKKRPIFIAAAVIITIFVAVWIASLSKTHAPSIPVVFDPMNASYDLDGKIVSFIDGHSEKEAVPGSAAKIETSIFGEPARGDLDADGDEDAALMIIENPGGTGTFFYVSVAINDSTGTIGIDSVFLGDRVIPQNISIINGEIVVNYTVREKGEPFSAEPTVDATTRIILVNGKLKIKY